MFSCIGLLLLSGGVSPVSIRRNIGPDEAIERVRSVRDETDEKNTPRKFQICEQFSDDNETVGLRLQGSGITVVTRLSA